MEDEVEKIEENNELKKEKEKGKEDQKDSNNIQNLIYSNLSTSDEINISYEKPKMQTYQWLSPDVFRCHLCKELLKANVREEGELIVVDYNCPNFHFGLLDIGLFVSKIPNFSFIFAKCSKCGLKQIKSKDIFYFCKDCEEIYCQNHINECKLCKDRIVSLKDLDFLCLIHKKDYISYCETCNENMCKECEVSEKHEKHKKYIFQDNLIKKEDNRYKCIDKKIQEGRKVKDNLENEIKSVSYFNLDNKEKEIIDLKNYIIEKIQVFGYLIAYCMYIKQSYDFSINCNRYNYQIIINFCELTNADFISNKFIHIDKSILNLKKKLYDFSLRNKISSDGELIKGKVINKYIFEDGEYIGEINEGLPHGHGTFKYKNGDEYDGEFKDGLFEGKGKHTTKNGDEYIGQFKKGKREGSGIYTFSNGDFYKGEFKEDMFHGKGLLFYINGNKTIGMWKNNKRNGNEFLFSKEGDIYHHIYENNTLMQERKCGVYNVQKDFKDCNNEQIIEQMNNFYLKQLKKK